MWSGASSGPRLKASMRTTHVLGAGLGVLDEDVEVAVFVEDARVEQLVLGRVLPARAVLVDQSARTGTRACGYL